MRSFLGVRRLVAAFAFASLISHLYGELAYRAHSATDRQHPQVIFKSATENGLDTSLAVDMLALSEKP